MTRPSAPPARNFTESATGCSSGGGDCRVCADELACASTEIGRNRAENNTTDPTTARLSTAYRLHFPGTERECGLGNWRAEMLETIAIILIVLWLLGVVSGYTLGNFIYVLLVVAIVLFLVRLISGRRVV